MRELARHRFAAPLFLTLLVLPLLLFRLGSAPTMWFDEGYKANAARTLVDHGVYGTSSAEGVLLFNAATTNGPVDTAVLALAYKLMGPGAATMRLGIIPFSLLAVIGLLNLATLMFGRRAALLSVLLVLAFPPLERTSPILLGRQVMGEIPALALVAWGLWLWFRAWQRGGSTAAAIAGGVLVGLGLLSKTQVAIGLLPALGAVSLSALFVRTTPVRRIILPPVAVGAVLIAWKALEPLACGQLSCPGNSEYFAAAIPVVLFTDLLGSNINRSGWLAAAVMLLSTVVTAWSLWQVMRRMHGWTAGHWAQTALALSVLFNLVWFVLLSIGWTRYAFFGWIVGVLLLGGPLSAALDRFAATLSTHRHPRLARAITPLAVVVLSISLYSHTALAIADMPAHDSLAAISHYIDRNIAPDAVIETWEWELGVSTQHSHYTYPDTIHMIYAIERQSHPEHPRIVAHEPYDPLARDPDYLVVGAFAELTGLYPEELIAANFVLRHTEGGYRLYERVRQNEPAP